ncbi:MAG: hypothetical protein PUG10_10125 [Lachnospiraceae bacterium]|nr:hypothetical protein [Lachnospiraceae bacterium]
MEEVIYSKYSMDRAKAFATKTVITKDDNLVKAVYKYAVSDASRAHINRIFDIYIKLTSIYKENVKVNKGILIENGIKLEYLEGISLEEILDKAFLSGENNAAVELIKQYIDKIINVLPKIKFDITDEFKKVFGDISFDEKVINTLEATNVANIDAIFSNVIINNDIWNILDYEWTFEFPIPLNFILFRALNVYLYSSDRRRRLWNEGIMEKFGIDKNQQELFAQMDFNFHKYVNGDRYSLSMSCDDIDKQKFIVDENSLNKKEGMVQVFIDSGKGYSEDNSYLQNSILDEEELFFLEILVPDNALNIRIDPADTYCMAYIKEFYGIDKNNNKMSIDYNNNYNAICQDMFVYNTDDPQWIISNNNKTIKKICVKYSLSRSNKQMTEKLLEGCSSDNKLGDKIKNKVGIIKAKASRK